MSARATGTGAATVNASQSLAPEIDGRSREAFDIEEDLWRAAALNDLAKWVGRAVHFVARVRQAGQLNDATQEWLRANGIEVPEWLDHHSLGLEALHDEVDEHLCAVRQIVGGGSRDAIMEPTSEATAPRGAA